MYAKQGLALLYARIPADTGKFEILLDSEKIKGFQNHSFSTNVKFFEKLQILTP